MRVIAGLAFLALSGCSEGGRFVTRDEAADIAGDACGDLIADDDTVRTLRSDLDEANDKIEDLESRLAVLELG